MAKTGSYCGRFGALSAGIALMFLGSVALAQVNANVEFSNISQTDPHPISYTWNGKKESIKEPTHYYTYFYLGTVDPDARVPKETTIERIAVSQDEWDANHKWITQKLTYYFQLTHSLPTTALGEMTGEAPASATTAVLGAPGAPGTPGAPGLPGAPTMPGMPGMPNMGGPQVDPYTGQPIIQGGNIDPSMTPPMPQGGIDPMTGQPMIDPATGQPIDPSLSSNYGYFGDPNMNMTMPQVNFGGPVGYNPAFDARAAAEWTFYYDQLVLWQYYCARQILDKEYELLEPNGLPPSQNPTEDARATLMQQQGGRQQRGRGGRSSSRGRSSASAMQSQQQQTPVGQPAIPGMPSNGTTQDPASQVSVVDLASAIQPGEAGKATIAAIRKRAELARAARPGVSTFPGANGANGAGAAQYGNMDPNTMALYNNMQQPGQTGLTGQAGQTGATLREMFIPLMDYSNKERAVQEYRVRFEEAAVQREQELHSSFLQMITDIEQRELNQERYEQWIDTKRKELYSYADDWRRAEDGQVFMSDDTLFVVTKDPNESLPLNAVGIPQAERVTPQDILNEDGTVKRPKVD